ncbi:MAG: response regulator [Patescibacteria group bacterium]|nr:response regulator [Patescibacteria group bacterium]
MSESILIVEDEQILQDVYKLVLSSKGYTVHTANNGAEGLMQLAAVKPNVVLLDIFMPVMDGKEFMRNVDMSEYPDTRIIVYTNLSDTKTQEEMLELGASEFVLKSSMTPRDLLMLIEKVTSAD